MIVISRQRIKYLSIQYYAPSNITCNGTWKNINNREDRILI